MKAGDISAIECSLAQTLGVIGDRWIMMILRDAFFGARTFDAFLEGLEISPTVLSDRLSRLVEEGVFVRQPSLYDARSHEYGLTQKGVDIYPIMAAMMEWGDKWKPCAKGTRLELQELATRQKVKGVRILSAEGRALEPYELIAIAGPGLDEKARHLVAENTKTLTGEG